MFNVYYRVEIVRVNQPVASVSLSIRLSISSSTALASGILIIRAHSCMMSVFLSRPRASIQLRIASHYFCQITIYLPRSSNIPLTSCRVSSYFIFQITSFVVSLNLWARSSSCDNLFFSKTFNKFFSISSLRRAYTSALSFAFPSSSTLNIPFHLSYSAFFLFSYSSASILQYCSSLSLFYYSILSFSSYSCSCFYLFCFSSSSIQFKASFLCCFCLAFSYFLNCFLRSIRVAFSSSSFSSSNQTGSSY